MRTPFPIAFLGATGAVGGETLKTLKARVPEGEIRIFGRRVLSKAGIDGSNLAEFVGDVSDARLYAGKLDGCQSAICTLGVGQPSKVSPEEFRRIDYECALLFARECRKAGVRNFSLMTAVGADAASRVYYLRTKGELEEAIEALGFESFRIFQPSMIITPTNRYGLIQGITLKLYPYLDALLVGKLRIFRSVRVEKLGYAIAMDCLHSEARGTVRLTWNEFGNPNGKYREQKS